MIFMGILWILWGFPLQLKANSLALTDGHTCVTDYWATISCSLKLPVTTIRSKNTSYWLEYYWISNHVTFICPLQRAHDFYSCSVKVYYLGSEFHEFMDVDYFKVTLNYFENERNISYMLDSFFHPAENIKPNAPHNLTLQYMNGFYNFIWKSGYEDHTYHEAFLFQYNFWYYNDGRNDSVTVDKEMIQISEINLDPDSTYTAMVRTKVGENRSYKGTWSDWSVAFKWKTRHKDEPNQIGRIAVGMCLILGLLILLVSLLAARLKIKEITLVPTPETYFQPLYKHYQGNFQCWVLGRSPLQDVRVVEEFSSIDKIDEVLSILQDQGEKTCPPAQCHTPYVVPTAEVWAPWQTFDRCTETSVSCEQFSLFCEALPKVDDLIQCLTTTCLSEDRLSLKGSTLSLESLEDCGPSEAPVIINPTPVCFKQDYCTLMDTPTGPAPTFSRDMKLDGDTTND